MRVEENNPAESSKAVLHALVAQNSLKVAANTGTATSVDLAALPRGFSFSALLSPNTPGSLPQITHNGTSLHSTYLICLALTEACPSMARGACYFLPVEKLPAGRPCDLVFVDEPWGSHSIKVWDTSNWLGRLSLLHAVTKISPAEDVIPICGRILKAGRQTVTGSKSPHQSSLSGEMTCRSYMRTSSTDFLPPDSNDVYYPYCSDFDPALRPSVCSYARPIEDLSTVLITYDSRTSTPFVCLAAAAEDESLCTRFPTPNHLSETFVRRGVPSADVERRAKSAEDRAAELVISGAVSSHAEVILELLHIWEKRQLNNDKDRQLFGRSSYMWQEILNRIEGFEDHATFNNMAFWPTTAS